MMTVCIFAPDLNHEFETIGFYFRLSGAEVIFATQSNGKQGSEHPQGLKRLKQTKCLRWISDEPDKIDLLILDAFIEPQYAEQRARWASHSSEIAFLFPHRGMTIKRRLGHLVRSWPYSAIARTSIFYGDKRLSLDTLSPALQRRTFYPPYLHPELFNDQALHQTFAEFEVMEPRRYPIGFMGNKTPQERFIALASSRRAIDQAGAQSFWIEYGDTADHHNALSSKQYLSALGEMDFCLCPAGWSVWTHRVVESLCRGAIPILPDPHLYGLGLQDSVNCISVKEDDWYGSVKNALSLPVHKLQEMRRNVLDLRENLLVPSAASRRFCQQFRIAP